MVEFSLVVGLFVMILYALIYFGMALATKQRVTNAAAEGARAAVGAPEAQVQTVALNRVKSLLGEPNGRYDVNPVAAACDSTNPTGPQCITVEIEWHWDTHPVVPAAPGLGVFPVNDLGSKATVQYSG
jgi:Flp pilus assembly protein TadG